MSHVSHALSSLSAQVRKHINDLYEDLRDGHNLISLLEVLSGEHLVSRPKHPVAQDSVWLTVSSTICATSTLPPSPTLVVILSHLSQTNY